MSCSSLNPRYWMHWDPTVPSCVDESSIATTHRLGDSSQFGDSALAELLSRYPRSDVRLSKMGRTFEHPNELQLGECGALAGAELLDLIRTGRFCLKLLRIDTKRDALATLTRNLGQEVDECLKASFEVGTATLEISSPHAIHYLSVELTHQATWQIRGQRSIRLFADSDTIVNSNTKASIASGQHPQPLYYEPEFEVGSQAIEQSPGSLVSIPAWQPFLIKNSGDLSVVLTTRHQTQHTRRCVEIHRANAFLRRFVPVNPPHQTGSVSGWLKQRIGMRLPINPVADRPTTFAVTKDRIDHPEECTNRAASVTATQAVNAPIQIQSPTLAAETTR